MSQDYIDDCFATDHVVQTDQQNIENNFAALKSAFSGVDSPPNTVAGMSWFDTTKKLKKLRNDANNAWLGVLVGTAALKLWLYLNAAQDGWAVDAGVADKVLAIKGGSNAYNVNGGQSAGTWTQLNHTHPGPSHTHLVRKTGWSQTTAQVSGTLKVSQNYSDDIAGADKATGAGGTETTGAGASGPAQRPAASVGTLQYPDI